MGRNLCRPSVGAEPQLYIPAKIKAEQKRIAAEAAKERRLKKTMDVLDYEAMRHFAEI